MKITSVVPSSVLSASQFLLLSLGFPDSISAVLDCLLPSFLEVKSLMEYLF